MPYHLYSSVLIYLIPTASISAVGPSCLLQPVLTDCNSLFPTYLYNFCYIRLIQPWQPNILFQSDTVSSEQFVGDNSLIQLWYHTCIRPVGATGCNSSVAFLRVYLEGQLPSIIGRKSEAKLAQKERENLLCIRSENWTHFRSIQEGNLTVKAGNIYIFIQ